VLARKGDAQALLALFDAVLPDVYRLALMENASVRQAERTTERVVDYLPEALRLRPWQSIEALRRHLLAATRRELTLARRRPDRPPAKVGCALSIPAFALTAALLLNLV
jgi:hypothetical protein